MKNVKKKGTSSLPTDLEMVKGLHPCKNPTSIENLEVWEVSTGGCFYVSEKSSVRDFVLVRVLSTSSYSVIHYVSIEGQVQQMEVRYFRNAYELELLRRTLKLCSEGLYFKLKVVPLEEYKRFERIASRHLAVIMNKREKSPREG